MNQKGFTPILILVGFLLVGGLIGGAYILGSNKVGKPEQVNVTQSNVPTSVANNQNPVIPTITVSQSSTTASKDETADWKTLINTSGFSIKYPLSMSVLGIGMNVDENDAPEVIISDNPDNPSSDTYLHILIKEISLTDMKSRTLQEIAMDDFNANMQAKYNPASVISSLTQINFAGQPAYSFSMINNGFTGKGSAWTAPRGQYKIIELEKDGLFYLIEVSNNVQMNKLLSTFKFTN